MRRAARPALQTAGLLALLVVLPVQAEVHRCVLADGRVEYRDRACPDDARQSTTREVATPPSALRAEMGPWRCAPDPAERTHPVFANNVKDQVEALPAVQRASLQAALHGLALGRCGLHGQGCGDLALSMHRERNGVVFICIDGRSPGEFKVLPDGRIVQRRGQKARARVLDPRLPAGHADRAYRIDLDGQRLEATAHGPGAAPSLEVLERER